MKGGGGESRESSTGGRAAAQAQTHLRKDQTAPAAQKKRVEVHARVAAHHQPLLRIKPI